MGQRIIAVFAAAGLVVGCSKKEAPAPEPTPTEVAHSARQAHAHAAPHGGQVESTPRGHLELVTTRGGGYRVYLLDDALALRPVAGATGSVKVAKGGYPNIVLTPSGDHLSGQGPEHADDHLAMVVTVVRDGKPEVARFAAHLEANGHGGGIVGTLRLAPCPTPPAVGLSAEACAKQGGVYSLEKEGGATALVLASPGQDVKTLLGARVGQRVHVKGTEAEGRVVAEAVALEHDHTPFHGGVVAMSGDTHLEVVSLRSGEVRVWVTDAFRQPLPLAGRKGTVEVGGVSAPLVPEGGGTFLTGTLPAADAEREVTVRLPLPEDPEYFIGFLLTPMDAPKPSSKSPESKGDAVQEVTITVQGGYQPSEVTLKQGVPARLRFVRKDSGGCGDELLIPDLGIQRPLPGLSETVVSFTPDKVGAFPFTCGMQMMKGMLVVQ
ncbi:cupredoxin domain-containing protein [Myxococcus sp. CA056]|uniref:cupredoxin domain-containing protein n=1 Tax=Myxococcus sp. CA056 TaxID=2741740 RepID=UPI00157B226B|nr:cupredoxin domain-containing protein [Myxococcus sp. CA056]NTX09414.1 cupredoxin domain-containing protein [Myxococcus sp. CA056]